MWIGIGTVINFISLVLQLLAVEYDQEWLFYIGFMVFGGIFGGIGYIAATQHAAFWLSSRRGMAGGFVGGAVGLGAVMYFQVLSRISADRGPVSAIGITCLLSSVQMLVCIPFMRFPSYAASMVSDEGSMTIREVLRTRELWPAALMVSSALVGGYGLVSDLGPMFVIVAYDYGRAGAAVTVATIAFAPYALARFFMGFVCDYIGVRASFAFLAVVQIICFFLLPSLTHSNPYSFIVVAIIALTMSGGGKVLSAAAAKWIFGADSATVALGLLLCFGIVPAGIMGPELLAGLKASDYMVNVDAYNKFFYVAGAMQVVSLVMALLIRQHPRALDVSRSQSAACE